MDLIKFHNFDFEYLCINSYNTALMTVLQQICYAQEGFDKQTLVTEQPQQSNRLRKLHPFTSLNHEDNLSYHDITISTISVNT